MTETPPDIDRILARYLATPQNADEACKLRFYINKLESRILELEAELERYKESADRSVCAYCGHIGKKNADACETGSRLFPMKWCVDCHRRVP